MPILLDAMASPGQAATNILAVLADPAGGSENIDMPDLAAARRAPGRAPVGDYRRVDEAGLRDGVSRSIALERGPAAAPNPLSRA